MERYLIGRRVHDSKGSRQQQSWFRSRGGGKILTVALIGGTDIFS